MRVPHRMIARALTSVLSRAAARAPVGGAYAALTGPPPVVDGKRIDAQTRYLLRLMQIAGPAAITELTPDAARVEYLRSGEAVVPAARALARVFDDVDHEAEVDHFRRVEMSVGREVRIPSLSIKAI